MLMAPPGTPDDRLGDPGERLPRLPRRRPRSRSGRAPGLWARRGGGETAVRAYLNDLAPRVEGLLAALEGA